MGDFRVTVEAVGGHGCQRDLGSGAVVPGCGGSACPDCITARYVAEMIRCGVSVKSAVLRHWPDTTGEVLDAFDTKVQGSSEQPRIRTGKF